MTTTYKNLPAITIDSTLPAGAATSDRQDTANTLLLAISNELTAGTLDVSDSAVQTLLTSILTQLGAGGIIIGTEDGTPTGTQHTFVNNIKNQILATDDRNQEIIYEDFGTKNQRIKEINYTSSRFPGVIAKKILTYVLESGKYKRTNIMWSIE